MNEDELLKKTATAAIRPPNNFAIPSSASIIFFFLNVMFFASFLITRRN
jgi:hypothetical protein